ncbi:hypothetical protein AVEN_213436-1, partial [Araneus ventricosus]
SDESESEDSSDESESDG